MNGELFQNMAPNAKRSFVVTVVLSAIATVLYLFCVQPCADELTAAKRRLAELQDRQYRTDVDLKRSSTVAKDLEDLENALKPFRAPPLPTPMPRQLHTRAAVKLTATGSYQQAVSFLLRVEKELPLVSLQQLDITARQNPRSQSISLVLEWPAKGGLTRK